MEQPRQGRSAQRVTFTQPWRKFRIGIQSERIRSISSYSESSWTNPKNVLSLVRRLKINLNETKKGFHSVLIRNNPSSDWNGTNRIDFQPICSKRNSKRFWDRFGNRFRNGSDNSFPKLSSGKFSILRQYIK